MTRPLPPLLPRISDYPAWHALRRPDAAALCHGAARMTYRELADAVDALAKALLAAGVGKGDRVASLHPPHPRFVVDLLAVASIGAIWVGLDPRYRLAELLRAVADSEPAILLARRRIGARSYQQELRQLLASSPTLRRVVLDDEASRARGFEHRAAFIAASEGVADADLAEAREQSGGREPCMIVYTSGSTGVPKGALLHHEGLALFATGQNRLWPVREYRSVNYFPINHVGSVADCTLPCLVFGGTLHFLEKFSPRACLELMERERITIWGSVPSAFRMMLDLPDFADADLSAVELIVWGGAAMPRPAIERLLGVCRRLATNYGMTEATSAITGLAPTDDPELLATAVGPAFPGVEVRIVGERDRAVPAGAVGEIQARSPLNFLGYWRNPAETAAAFAPGGWLRTGDLGRRRPGGLYELAGRRREMFKSGGYNVYPREVETALEAHPGVLAAAVIAVPDAEWQEVGVAFVAAEGPVCAEALSAWLRSRLANYKIPKRFVILPELPLLPIGKVDKPALRRLAGGLFGAAGV